MSRRRTWRRCSTGRRDDLAERDSRDVRCEAWAAGHRKTRAGLSRRGLSRVGSPDATNNTDHVPRNEGDGHGKHTGFDGRAGHSRYHGWTTGDSAGGQRRWTVRDERAQRHASAKPRRWMGRGDQGCDRFQEERDGSHHRSRGLLSACVMPDGRESGMRDRRRGERAQACARAREHVAPQRTPGLMRGTAPQYDDGGTNAGFLLLPAPWTYGDTRVNREEEGNVGTPHAVAAGAFTQEIGGDVTCWPHFSCCPHFSLCALLP
jgi:hypothetical protein